LNAIAAEYGDEMNVYLTVGELTSGLVRVLAVDTAEHGRGVLVELTTEND
jgi:hypothetical protein